MTSTQRHLTIAYSPDTDDAFMVHALKSGLMDWEGYHFEFVAADIQQLNRAATEQRYDVTAISVAAYPSLAKDYLLMPIGASIGDRFGPALIVRPDSPTRTPEDLRGHTVAIPGLQTSAFFAARGLIGAFEAVPMGFLDIAPAVLSGEVDAGILIHELQLRCEERGLRKVADLGELWGERHGLPLPLGANAIRRALGPKVIADVTRLMRRSIELGLGRRRETLVAALASSKADLDLSGGDRYISMYVNDRSLGIQGDVRRAIERLFGVGEEFGLCPATDLDAAFYD